MLSVEVGGFVDEGFYVVLAGPLGYGGFDGFDGLVFDVDGFCCSGHWVWFAACAFMVLANAPSCRDNRDLLINHINHFLTDLIRLWTYFVFGSKLFIA